MIRVIWGVIVVALALLAWGGQLVSLLFPKKAAQLGLKESPNESEPAFEADGKGEALWDAATLWTLLVAGVLLILDAAAWPHFGLIGGAIYVYFAGRGVLTRIELRRQGLRIGSEANVRSAFVLLPVWGVAGMITILAAAVAL